MNDSSSKFAILGASGGIGSALARRLSAHGHQLALGARRREPLDALAAELRATALEVDGREFEQVDRFLQRAAEELGGLSGVVNCAGSVLLKPAHLTSQQDFEDVVATNLSTAFAVVRAAAKVLRAEGGSVVLISSGAARIGLANHEAIAAAKAGVAALAQSAAATYAGKRIRFNAVAPGLVATDATRRIVENDRALEASLRLHPLGRVGAPEEVAGLIEWLLGPESEWVTGQVLGIDGGLASIKLGHG